MQDPQSLEYQILQQGDFPPPPDNDADAEPSPYAQYEHVEDHEYDPPVQVKRGGRPKGSLTNSGNAKEKKDKMRVQNRAAAERSRAKKRDELTSLELTVQNIQEENQRLRNQLQTLLASGNASNVPANESVPETSANPDTLGLDYDLLSTLQTELESLEAKIQSASNPSAQLAALTHTLNEKTIQADALRDTISHLKTTREAVHTEKEVLEREIQGRKILAKAREIVGEDDRFEGLMGVPGGLGGGRAVGVERALLDVRSMLDEAVRTWNQTASLPPRRGNTAGENLAPLALLAAASSRNGS